MGYIETRDMYVYVSNKIGYLERQQEEGDIDLLVSQELESLRREQKELSEKLESYAMEYNSKTWRCD